MGKHPPQTPTPRLLDAEEELDLGQLARHAEGAQQGLVVAEVGRRPGQHGEAGDGPAAAGPLVRLGVAAEPLLRLKYVDVVAGGGEGPGRAAAGDAAPDHGDPHRRHRSRRPQHEPHNEAPGRAVDRTQLATRRPRVGRGSLRAFAASHMSFRKRKRL